jgi:glycosyltransferase involved in cell wall biosynthesis
MPRNVLFVTPTFSATGSEIALANLLSAIDTKLVNPLLFVNTGRGELVADLPDHVTVFRPPLWNVFAGSSMMHIIRRKIFTPTYLWFLVKRHKIEFIYVNTITLPHILTLAKRWKIPSILHTHELEHMYGGLTEAQTQESIFSPISIIAASNHAAQVIRNFGRLENLTVIYSTSRDPVSRRKSVNHISENRHAHAPFTWMMVGTLDANKNPVRFVQIAARYLALRKQDRFLWLGSGKSGYSLYAQKLGQSLGLGDKIQWLGFSSHVEYERIFDTGDGLILTSDAESLSLVAIEALSRGKPVVSFENGGISEIIDKQTGVLIPKFELQPFVESMNEIAQGRKKFARRLLMRQAKQFSIEVQGKLWNELIERILR